MKFTEVPSPVAGMRCWAARSAGYSFVISHEPMIDDPEFQGYTASWKSLKADMRPHGSQPANRIDGSTWDTFHKAEQACRATLKQLKQQN